MDAFNTVMRREFALVPQGSVPTPTQIKRIAKGLEPRRRALEKATSSFSDAWRGLDADIAAMVRAADAVGSADLSAKLRSSLTGLSASLEMPAIDETAAQVKALAAFSRELRPVAKTMTGVLAAIEAIRASAAAWAQEL